MRKLIYVLLLVPLLFVPLHRVEIAELQPIEAVAVYMDEDKVVLETDSEHTGTGETAVEALAAMKENASVVIYLDTAKYLLVSEAAIPQVEALRPFLKPSVRVSVCDAKGKVKDTAKYLDVHEKLPKLKAWKAENYTN